MRVENTGIPPWQQEYLQNAQGARRPSEVEGVTFERSLQSAESSKPAECAPVDRQSQPNKAAPTDSDSEMLSLLSSEEKRVLSSLFTEDGPQWGVRAYRAASNGALPARGDDEPTSGIDLIG